MDVDGGPLPRYPVMLDKLEVRAIARWGSVTSAASGPPPSQWERDLLERFYEIAHQGGLEKSECECRSCVEIHALARPLIEHFNALFRGQ